MATEQYYGTGRRKTSSARVYLRPGNGAITINLPAASSSSGLEFYVVKIDGDANNVTLDANSTETINGSETQVISAQWGRLHVVCDGTSWTILGA